MIKSAQFHLIFNASRKSRCREIFDFSFFRVSFGDIGEGPNVEYLRVRKESKLCKCDYQEEQIHENLKVKKYRDTVSSNKLYSSPVVME